MGIKMLADRDQELWWEEPGGGTKDGQRPVPVPTSTLQPTVPFKAHEFVH